MYLNFRFTEFESEIIQLIEIHKRKNDKFKITKIKHELEFALPGSTFTMKE